MIALRGLPAVADLPSALSLRDRGGRDVREVMARLSGLQIALRVVRIAGCQHSGLGHAELGQRARRLVARAFRFHVHLHLILLHALRLRQRVDLLERLLTPGASGVPVLIVGYGLAAAVCCYSSVLVAPETGIIVPVVEHVIIEVNSLARS